MENNKLMLIENNKLLLMNNKKLLQMETWMWWRSSKNVIPATRKECVTLQKKKL
jgi:hypothetical protein